MSATTPMPGPKTNHIGLSVIDYRGGKTTLCAGCGHNAITERIIDAAFEMCIQPENVAKLSGIGCSSKSPAYFLNRAHGFNSVHGRMPSVATGVVLANHKLIALGVTGDGDTASIGIGQFVHLMRRNLPLIYVIEDNGVYGLTKGQFSATADLGAKLKTGVINDLPAIDTCLLAIQLGATFVARTTHTDPNHVLQMMEAAMGHDGFSFIECLSECVEFCEGAFDASNPRKGGAFNLVPETHDVTDEIAAYKLADEPFPGKFGVFYKVDRPTKNKLEADINAKAKERVKGLKEWQILQQNFDKMK